MFQLVGVDKCLETLHDLIVDVKKKVGIDQSTPLQSMVGLVSDVIFSRRILEENEPDYYSG